MLSLACNRKLYNSFFLSFSFFPFFFFSPFPPFLSPNSFILSFFFSFFFPSFLPPFLSFSPSCCFFLFFFKKKEGLILKCQKLVSESNSSLKNLTEQSAFYLQSWVQRMLAFSPQCVFTQVFIIHLLKSWKAQRYVAGVGNHWEELAKAEGQRSHYSFLTEGLVLHQDRNSASNLHIDLHFIPDGLQRAWLVCWEPEFQNHLCHSLTFSESLTRLVLKGSACYLIGTKLIVFLGQFL